MRDDRTRAVGHRRRGVAASREGAPRPTDVHRRRLVAVQATTP
jgi:hypothetical protein